MVKYNGGFLDFEIVIDGFSYDNLKAISKDYGVSVAELQKLVKKSDTPDVTSSKISKLVGFV